MRTKQKPKQKQPNEKQPTILEKKQTILKPQISTSPTNGEVKLMINPKRVQNPPTTLSPIPIEPKIIQKSPTKEQVVIKNSPPVQSKPLEIKELKNTSLKLITESFEAQPKLFQEHYLEKTDYTVIGVLGESEVGKTFLLNEILNSNLFDTKETFGVDCVITKEKQILLDTQALFNSSLFSSDIKFTLESMGLENYLEFMSLKIALFLMSVCHVIIVVMDDVTDYKTLKLIKTALMLTKGISFIKDAPKEIPEIIFCYNRLDQRDFSTNNILLINDFLSKYFKDTNIKKSGIIKPIKGLKNDINFYMIKEGDSPKDLIQSLNTIKGSWTTNDFNWVQNASRIWELLKNSHFLIEYNRIFQKLQIFK